MKRRGGNCRDWVIPVALIAVIAVIAAALLAPTRERAFGDIAGFEIGDVTGADLRLEAAGRDVELGADEAAGLLERLWALECRGGAPQTAMQGPYARVRLYAGLDGCEVILAPGAPDLRPLRRRERALRDKLRRGGIGNVYKRPGLTPPQL